MITAMIRAQEGCAIDGNNTIKSIYIVSVYDSVVLFMISLYAIAPETTVSSKDVPSEQHSIFQSLISTQQQVRPSGYFILS